MDFAPIPPGGNPGKLFGKNDLAKERADQFARMNKEPLITVKYGDGRKKLLIISAPECPTCKKLESELSQNESVLNATIYYVPVRLNGSADPVLSNFWCASGDKGNVWLNWWKTGALPTQVTPNCQYSYKDSYALWKFFGQKEDGRLTGTPTVVQEDGTTYAGYPPDKGDFLRMFGGTAGSATETTVAVSQANASTNLPGIGQTDAESRSAAATQSKIDRDVIAIKGRIGTRTTATPQTNASQQGQGNSPGNLPQRVQDALDYLRDKPFLGKWTTVRLVDNFLVFEYVVPEGWARGKIWASEELARDIRRDDRAPKGFPYENTGIAIPLNAIYDVGDSGAVWCKGKVKCISKQSNELGIQYVSDYLISLGGDYGPVNAFRVVVDYIVKQYGAWIPQEKRDSFGGLVKTTNPNFAFDRFQFSVISNKKRCERENRC